MIRTFLIYSTPIFDQINLINSQLQKLEAQTSRNSPDYTSKGTRMERNERESKFKVNYVKVPATYIEYEYGIS